MARVTVEDCIEKIENRFELVMMASQRTRKIGMQTRKSLKQPKPHQLLKRQSLHWLILQVTHQSNLNIVIFENLASYNAGFFHVFYLQSYI